MTFGDKILRHIPTLTRFAFKLTKRPEEVEDLVHDTVVQALINADKFQEGTNLRAWLCTIMRNLFFTRVRRTKVVLMVSDDVAMGRMPANVSSPTTVIEVQEILARIERLPESQRGAILMASEGMAYEEIAAEMGIPVGTVKSRLFRARAAIEDHAGLRGVNR